MSNVDVKLFIHVIIFFQCLRFDRTLGGLEFTLRLRDYLAKEFNSQKKTKTQVETNNRAMAKLLKEAERVKKVLSANNDHKAQVCIPHAKYIKLAVNPTKLKLHMSYTHN